MHQVPPRHERPAALVQTRQNRQFLFGQGDEGPEFARERAGLDHFGG